MRSLALIAFCMLTVISSFAQTRVVKGKLTAFNTYPVKNIAVESKKAGSTVMTDTLGQFELVCNEKDVIQIKNDVFEAMNKKIVEDDQYITANLIFRDTKKNRQIATGMGYISHENLTYALSQMSHENNNFCSYSDVYSLITGKFTSVQVKASEMGGKGIFVRGQKSLLGDNEAIYMVDGARVADISFIFPCDIAAINILKDGGAALYGSQGANGVVVIETKGYFQRTGSN